MWNKNGNYLFFTATSEKREIKSPNFSYEMKRNTTFSSRVLNWLINPRITAESGFDLGSPISRVLWEPHGSHESVNVQDGFRKHLPGVNSVYRLCLLPPAHFLPNRSGSRADHGLPGHCQLAILRDVQSHPGLRKRVKTGPQAQIWVLIENGRVSEA